MNMVPDFLKRVGTHPLFQRADLWLLLVLGLNIAYVVIDGMTNRLGIDSAANLHVSRNFHETLNYASDGWKENSSKTYFDARITTGPTVLVPVAAGFFFGEHWIIGVRLIMGFFWLSMILALWRISSTLVPVQRALIAIMPIGFSLAANDQYAEMQGPSDVLGEMPATSLILWSIINAKKRPLTSGFLFSLSLLAKQSALFFLPLVAIFVAALAIGVLESFQRLAKFLGACLAPVFSWELYKLAVLGFEDYRETSGRYFRYISEKIGHSGITRLDEPRSFLEELPRLFNLLPIDNLALTLVSVLGAGTIILIAITKVSKKDFLAFKSTEWAMVVFGLIHVCWWLVFYDAKYDRAVFTGLVMLNTGYAILMFSKSKSFGRTSGNHFFQSAIRVNTGILLAIILATVSVKFLTPRDSQLAAQVEVAEQISQSDLPLILTSDRLYFHSALLLLSDTPFLWAGEGLLLIAHQPEISQDRLEAAELVRNDSCSLELIHSDRASLCIGNYQSK